MFKHDAVGTPGDIIVVMGETLWEGSAGDSLKKHLEAAYKVLPQNEPKFNLSQIPPSAFNKFSQKARNILIVKISKEFSKTGVSIEYDLWATPQIVVKIKAKDHEQLLELISKNGDAITKYFEKAHLERLSSAFKNISNKKVVQHLKKKHKISLSIPSYFSLAEDKDNFIWIRNETQKLSQGILIWEYPYTDTLQLTLNSLLEIRDSVTMNNVPGPDPETSFMTSEKRVNPVFEKLKINDNFAAVTRGLWRVEGDFMGGPFVNYAIVDEKHNRIVTIDVFVYAGRQNKREFIREMEAIANSVEFTD